MEKILVRNHSYFQSKGEKKIKERLALDSLQKVQLKHTLENSIMFYNQSKQSQNQEKKWIKKKLDRWGRSLCQVDEEFNGYGFFLCCLDGYLFLLVIGVVSFVVVLYPGSRAHSLQLAQMWVLRGRKKSAILQPPMGTLVTHT